MPDRSRGRRPRWRRPLALGVGVAVVLVAAGGGVAWAMSARGGDRYTTATVAMGSVQQTVSATGSIASASRRDVSFPVAGTVASVAVGLGDTVTAGQVLASLDPASLQDALDQANTTLQSAQQTLSDDLESQTASATSSSSSSSSASSSSSSSNSSGHESAGGGSSAGSGSTGGSGTTSGSSPAVQKATKDVASAQQALLKAYDDAHAALGTSATALSNAQAACAAIDGLDPSTVVADGAGDTAAPSPTDTSSPAPTDTASADPTDSPSPSASPSPSPTSTGTSVSAVKALVAACQQALSTASDAQAATKTAQQAVSDAAAALDRAVAALQTALGSPATGSNGSSGGGAGTQPTATSTPTPTATRTAASTPTATATSSSASRSTSSVGQAAKVATAADILADRAAIDAAQATVDIATKNLTLVDLTSPIAGTVGAVSITAGATVSASSTSAVITVLGTDGYTADLTVPLSSLGKLAVGQSATVTVPSTTTPLTGKVSSIGVLDVSSTSTPEYAVVVALDPTTEKLFDGSSAQVSIAVAATGQVLTVPTSAVHVDGSAATVQVLQDGVVSDVTVQRGAVGAELTEITSGLTAGQVVVLADRSQPLETGSTSSSSSGLSGLTSGTTTRVGVGGAGFPAGGTFSGRG